MPRRAAADDARVAALAASRALLTVTAVAVAAGALVAACAPSTTGRRGAGAHRTPAPRARVDAALREAGASGLGVAVWVPNGLWLDGDPGAEPFVRALEWVATTGPSAAPSGTVTVRQDAAGDGAVRVVVTDDDAELAAALATLADADTLVRDRAGWLVVTGSSVRPLLAGDRAGLPGTFTVAQLRDRLAARAPGGEPVGS
ncbi:hypothetical protein [uncultured Cellulomonas sp.]|uniref:hypothetical protein n=1 Tax=uncultured Cellulomonas sp. TaxID=189682 RepID=UPI0026303376|nr:hypothetical protein [uncultured Cellulomonas sp.]